MGCARRCHLAADAESGARCPPRHPCCRAARPCSLVTAGAAAARQRCGGWYSCGGGDQGGGGGEALRGGVRECAYATAGVAALLACCSADAARTRDVVEPPALRLARRLPRVGDSAVTKGRRRCVEDQRRRGAPSSTLLYRARQAVSPPQWRSGRGGAGMRHALQRAAVLAQSNPTLADCLRRATAACAPAASAAGRPVLSCVRSNSSCAAGARGAPPQRCLLEWPVTSVSPSSATQCAPLRCSSAQAGPVRQYSPAAHAAPVRLCKQQRFCLSSSRPAGRCVLAPACIAAVGVRVDACRVHRRRHSGERSGVCSGARSAPHTGALAVTPKAFAAATVASAERSAEECSIAGGRAAWCENRRHATRRHVELARSSSSRPCAGVARRFRGNAAVGSYFLAPSRHSRALRASQRARILGNTAGVARPRAQQRGTRLGAPR